MSSHRPRIVSIEEIDASEPHDGYNPPGASTGPPGRNSPWSFGEISPSLPGRNGSSSTFCRCKGSRQSMADRGASRASSPFTSRIASRWAARGASGASLRPPWFTSPQRARRESASARRVIRSPSRICRPICPSRSYPSPRISEASKATVPS